MGVYKDIVEAYNRKKVMKMTAFTDGERTRSHELDLDAIKKRVENCMGSGVIAAKVLEDDAPTLIAEVERLRVKLREKDKSLRDMANHYNSVQEQLKRSNDWLRYVIKNALDEEVQHCEGQETEVFKMLREALGVTSDDYWSAND